MSARARVVLCAAIVAGATLLAAAPAVAKEKPTEVSKCVEEAVRNGTQADTCLKAPNPLTPSTNELVWGSLSFIVLFVLLAKVAYPGIKKMMDERAEKIRSNLDEAEQTQQQAQSILAEYKSQLADAKNEAARIIEEARQAADRRAACVRVGFRIVVGGDVDVVREVDARAVPDVAVHVRADLRVGVVHRARVEAAT